MTIEEKIFQRKKFIPQRMLEHGFIKTPSGFTWESDFMDGNFQAIIMVSDKGHVSSKIIDKMTNEEYTPIRIGTRTGAFVNSVRAAYEDILTSLVKNCCEDVLFASDQANRLASYIMEKYRIYPDFPWGQKQYQTYATFRHEDNKKWFALLMDLKWDSLLKNGDVSKVGVVNLKINPKEVEELISIRGIYPGYHMNHKHWISVILNDTLGDDLLADLVDKSFNLTKSKKSVRNKDRE